MPEASVIETLVRLEGERCTVRIPQGEQQGPKRVLVDGDVLEVTPMPGLWLSGTYHSAQVNNEHYWQYDEHHFLGLVDGMRVRVALSQETSPQASNKEAP
jgi:hypothetical protein